MMVGLAAASGLSATMLLTHLLKSGEHIVCVDDVYGGNNNCLINCTENCVHHDWSEQVYYISIKRMHYIMLMLSW